MYVPDPGPESRFTAPRPDCPNPGYWTSDDADSTEYQVSALVAGFITALQPEYVVETGTAFGQTAQYIGQALKANGHGELVSLEPDPQRAEYSRQRCAGLPVDVREVKSLDFIPERTVDFAWLDSLFHLRADEASRYHPWFRVGSVVGMHDTGPQHPLGPSIDRLLGQGWLRAIFLPTPRGVMFAEVIA